MVIRPSARDDVLADFIGKRGRTLLVEVDDRGNVPGDVGGEEVADAHRLWGILRDRCGGGSRGRASGGP